MENWNDDINKYEFQQKMKKKRKGKKRVDKEVEAEVKRLRGTRTE